MRKNISNKEDHNFTKVKDLARAWALPELFSELKKLNAESLFRVFQTKDEYGNALLHLAAFGYLDFLAIGSNAWNKDDCKPFFQLVQMGADPLITNQHDKNFFAILYQSQNFWIYSYITDLQEFQQANPSFNSQACQNICVERFADAQNFFNIISI